MMSNEKKLSDLKRQHDYLMQIRQYVRANNVLREMRKIARA